MSLSYLLKKEKQNTRWKVKANRLSRSVVFYIKMASSLELGQRDADRCRKETEKRWDRALGSRQ